MSRTCPGFGGGGWVHGNLRSVGVTGNRVVLVSALCHNRIRLKKCPNGETMQCAPPMRRSRSVGC
nr:hypothetical protein JVH1_2960 [Rhodococcus sp. JVH1]